MISKKFRVSFIVIISLCGIGILVFILGNKDEIPSASDQREPKLSSRSRQRDRPPSELDWLQSLEDLEKHPNRDAEISNLLRQWSKRDFKSAWEEARARDNAAVLLWACLEGCSDGDLTSAFTLIGELNLPEKQKSDLFSLWWKKSGQSNPSEAITQAIEHGIDQKTQLVYLIWGLGEGFESQPPKYVATEMARLLNGLPFAQNKEVLGKFVFESFRGPGGVDLALGLLDEIASNDEFSLAQKKEATRGWVNRAVRSDPRRYLDMIISNRFLSSKFLTPDEEKFSLSDAAVRIYRESPSEALENVLQLGIERVLDSGMISNFLEVDSVRMRQIVSEMEEGPTRDRLRSEVAKILGNQQSTETTSE